MKLMSESIKFKWFLLTVVALLVVVSSSVISSSGELENAQEAVRQNPNDAKAHYNLGNAYVRSGQHQDAIASFKESIRINPNLAEVHYNLGLSFGQTNNGFGAITHTIIAVKLFERQNNSQLSAFAKSNLRNWFKGFQKYRPEDFANIQIPRPSQPSSPDDAQLIIDAAKTGYLTEELHKKYWDDLKKKGGDKHLFKTITDWYPRINRLQMQHNREFVKSLKLTLKNKTEYPVCSSCRITFFISSDVKHKKVQPEGNLPFAILKKLGISQSVIFWT